MCLKGSHDQRESVPVSPSTRKWIQDSDKRRETSVVYLGDLRDPETSCKSCLSCCRDLSLQFPIPPSDSSSACVNSSAPWNDSRADNQTALCIPMCAITQRTEEILQGTWEAKTNTRDANCVWTLFWSKPMKHFMSIRFENVQMLKNQQLCFHFSFPVLLHTLHTKII